jgi:hypothetical protein
VGVGVKMDADALRAFLEETFPAAVALGYNLLFSSDKKGALAAFRRVLEIAPSNDAALTFVEALEKGDASKSKSDAKSDAK